eukprot:sb/3463937/
MFMLYLVKLLKFIPEYIKKYLNNKRSASDLLGPSSYERLEYEKSDDDGSVMTDGEEDDIMTGSGESDPMLGDEVLISSQDIRDLNSPLKPKKSALKHRMANPAGSSNNSFLTANSNEHISAADALEQSTSRRIKFRSVAEVRCLASHDLNLQREARRPFNHRGTDSTKLTTREHIRTAIFFSFLWFVGNYLNALALEKTTLSNVEVLSATSSVFVLVLSAAFPVGEQDRISLTKFLLVLVNVAGVVVLCFQREDPSGPPTTAPPTNLDWDNFMQPGNDVTGNNDVIVDETGYNSMIGILFAIASSMIYAVYMVYFRRVAGSEDGSDDKVDIVLFFGTVGFFSALFLLPLFPILHFAEIEDFKWPTGTELKFLVLTALLGTVISDMLWLWSSLLTSSLVATIGLALTSPVSILVDIMVNKRHFNFVFFLGTLCIFISYVCLNFLNFVRNPDPVSTCLAEVYRVISCRMGSFRSASDVAAAAEVTGLLDTSCSSDSQPVDLEHGGNQRSAVSA